MAENAPSVVAITGVSGQLGGTLAQLLEEDDRVAHVVGLDVRPPTQSLAKTRFFQQDVSAPGMENIFRDEGVTHVAHFAFILDTIRDRERAHRVDVGGSRNVLSASSAVGVKKIVVSSSSVVFGAHSDNPTAIPEDHPRRPHPRIQYTLDKVEVEDLCASFAKEHPATRVVVLRPVTIVGPRMANFISRSMEKPVVLLPAWHNPPWQFVHEVDCARAAQVMLFNGLSGVYNLGADGTVGLAELLREHNRRVTRVPRLLMKTVADLCWYLGLTRLSEVHGPLVDFMCWVPVLDNSRLKREADFQFRYTSREAIEDYFRARAETAPTALGVRS
jgi:UDP-glucose 4-epimerase